MSKKERITIKYVAKMAGVSTATVTRVLHNNEKVKLETRGRVLQAIKKLDYEPSIAARSLKGAKTGVIGIDFPYEREMFVYDFYTVEVARAIMNKISSGGNPIFLLNRLKVQNEITLYNHLISSHIADGLLIVDPPRDKRVIEFLIEEKFPFVLLGEPPDYRNRVTYVDSRNSDVAYIATNYLIERGKKHIGIINFPRRLNASRLRLEGYKKCLLDHNMEFNKKLVEFTKFNIGEIENVTNRLIDKGVDSIVASCDFFAITALKKIKERGLSIPEDIDIIGANNSPFLVHISPPIPSIAFNSYETTVWAIEALIKMIQKGSKPIVKKATINIVHNKRR